ncbi:5-formyltetrahydrofolate cyclo-ligase [Rhodococcus subtropicus]|uniref:5-formyltetrahydrofolate cyclo-ligase n=1 Tax=Prescottella subtropica TaxID=2545757 RepID=UPI0010F882B0
MCSKADWRAHVLGERRSVAPEVRVAEATALVRSITSAAAALAPARGAGTVCAYVPVGSEPGSVAMLDALRESGWRVLLPVTGAPGPLGWAEFTGADSLIPAAHGLREPTGPVLPSSEVGTASVLFVPALAVDRSGVRLGRGAGFYDRTLGAITPGTPLVAVVRDDELVASLPADPHDVPMTHALTPGLGPVPLIGPE